MSRYFKNENGNAIPYSSVFTFGRTRMLEKGYVPYEGTLPDAYLYFNSEGILSEYTEEEYTALQEAKALADEQRMFSKLYLGNPDLELRVKEYKQLLESIGLSPTANIDAVNTHIQSLQITDGEKLAMVLQISAIYNNGIVYNLDYSHVPNPISFGWDNMNKLIQYLSVEEPQE